MAGSLLQGFRELDALTKDALADLSSPILLAFAALSIAQKKCSVDRLSVEHITACLEAAGVAVTKSSILNALARAGNRVSTSTGLEGETLYRLMTRGEREIAPALGGGDMAVVRIEGGTPRTARMRLGAVLARLAGTVRTTAFAPSTASITFPFPAPFASLRPGRTKQAPSFKVRLTTSRRSARM